MFRLRCIVTACVVMLSVGTTNASTTFDWSFTTDYSYISGSGTLNATYNGGGQYAIDSISGQVTFGSGLGVGCNTPCVAHYDSIIGLLPFGTNYSAIQTYGDNQIFYPAAPSLDHSGISVAIYNSLYPVNTWFGIHYGTAEFGSPGYVLYLSNSDAYRAYFTLSPSVASATPLPAALPLFASGLGALGLLGWRRKRKAAALAA